MIPKWPGYKMTEHPEDFKTLFAAFGYSRKAPEINGGRVEGGKGWRGGVGLITGYSQKQYLSASQTRVWVSRLKALAKNWKVTREPPLGRHSSNYTRP